MITALRPKTAIMFYFTKSSLGSIFRKIQPSGKKLDIAIEQTDRIGHDWGIPGLKRKKCFYALPDFGLDFVSTGRFRISRKKYRNRKSKKRDK